MDNVIWGAAAAAAIGSATAYVLEQQKRRKEEEARARLEAERANAEARAIEKGYDSCKDMVETEARAAFDANWNAILAATQTATAIQPGISSGRHLKKREKPVQAPPPPSKQETSMNAQLITDPDNGRPEIPIEPTQQKLVDAPHHQYQQHV